MLSCHWTPSPVTEAARIRLLPVYLLETQGYVEAWVHRIDFFFMFLQPVPEARRNKTAVGPRLTTHGVIKEILLLHTNYY